MKVSRNSETRQRRIDKINNLGLDLIHINGECFKVIITNYTGSRSFLIDFSAIDENKFLDFFIKRIFKLGVDEGRADVANQLNKILSFAKEDDYAD